MIRATASAWLAALLLAGVAGVGIGPVAAWDAVLTAADTTASPGQTVVFSGTITNDTGADLLLSASVEFGTSPESEKFVVDFADAFLATDLIVPPAGYSGPLFQVMWTVDAPSGMSGTGELRLGAEGTVTPAEIALPFTIRTPGLANFCRESTGFLAISSSVAFHDSLDVPRIAFNGADSSLSYASRSSSGVWSKQVIQTGIGVNAAPSLALDGGLFPHIAYHDAVKGDLKYARNPSGTWQIEAVDTAGFVGASPSLRCEGLDIVHVSYRDNSQSRLKYARRSASSWSVEVVDAAANVGTHTSIAVETDGTPHIGYYDVTNGDLKHAWKASGVWTVETVDAVNNVGAWPSIEVRGSDVFISYRDETAGRLKLAVKTGATWSTEVVDSDGDTGYFTSLELNALGRPRIVYYEGSSGAAQYAGKVNGVNWEFTTIEAGDPSPGSLRLSGDNEVFVSYAGPGRSLKYAATSGCAFTGVADPSHRPAPALVVRSIRPNPFSARVAISFTTGQRATWRVRVYDAAGRLVSEPFNATAGPGDIDVSWDGTNSRGRRVAAGVYWYEIQTRDVRQTGRVVLIR